MSKKEREPTRLNVAVRLLGLLSLIAGIVLAYNTSTTPLSAQIAPVFYLISVLLMASGLFTLVARFE